MTVGLKRGLESDDFVASGDYIDAASEDGVRVNDKALVRYVDTLTNDATNIFAVDGGTGTLGMGGTSTGSTATVAFTASFTANPYVVGTQTQSGLAWAGSTAISMAGRDTGSAVFFGPSGAGFHWIALGQQY